MKNQLKIGIVGCGAIAESHLKGYQENGLSPLAFADVSKARANDFAAKSGTGEAYGDYLELLDSGVEEIRICTPPISHREIAVEALKRDIHVLCEKPLAATLADCKAIEEAVASSKGKFMMGFRHRFLPAHQKMLELIQAGDFGKIILFRNIFGGLMPEMKDKWFANRAIAGGGVLMDTSVHGVDLFRFYCGEIAGASGQVHRAFQGTDVEDTGALLLRSGGGTLGSLVSSWNIGTWNAVIEIDTESGSLTYDYNKSGAIKVRRGAEESELEIAVSPTGGFAEQIACFLRAIEGEGDQFPSVIDGRKVAEVLDGVYSENN